MNEYCIVLLFNSLYDKRLFFYRDKEILGYILFDFFRRIDFIIWICFLWIKVYILICRLLFKVRIGYWVILCIFF